MNMNMNYNTNFYIEPIPIWCEFENLIYNIYNLDMPNTPDTPDTPNTPEFNFEYEDDYEFTYNTIINYELPLKGNVFEKFDFSLFVKIQSTQIKKTKISNLNRRRRPKMPLYNDYKHVKNRKKYKENKLKKLKQMTLQEFKTLFNSIKSKKKYVNLFKEWTSVNNIK